MSRWLPSLNTPVAVSCRLLPSGTVGVAGEIKIDVRDFVEGRAAAADEPPPQPDSVTVSESSKRRDRAVAGA